MKTGDASEIALAPNVCQSSEEKNHPSRSFTYLETTCFTKLQSSKFHGDFWEGFPYWTPIPLKNITSLSQVPCPTQTARLRDCRRYLHTVHTHGGPGQKFVSPSWENCSTVPYITQQSLFLFVDVNLPKVWCVLCVFWNHYILHQKLNGTFPSDP